MSAGEGVLQLLFDSLDSRYKVQAGYEVMLAVANWFRECRAGDGGPLLDRAIVFKAAMDGDQSESMRRLGEKYGRDPKALCQLRDEFEKHFPGFRFAHKATAQARAAWQHGKERRKAA